MVLNKNKKKKSKWLKTGKVLFTFGFVYFYCYKTRLDLLQVMLQNMLQIMLQSMLLKIYYTSRTI